jgi:hypothetical protein
MERPLFQLERVSLFFYASYELLHRHDQQRKYILFYFFAEKQNCLYFLFLSIFLHIFNLDAFFGFSFGLLLLFSLQSSFSLFFLCRSFSLSVFLDLLLLFCVLFTFLVCCDFSLSVFMLFISFLAFCGNLLGADCFCFFVYGF